MRNVERHVDEHPLALDGGGADAVGSLTSMPRWISGAVTMKMISSTSITSTSGTTLISASEVATRWPRPARPEPLPVDGVDLGHQVKLRSAMFRNSIAKSSISEANSLTRFARWLYATSAGMAAARPKAVAMSASAIGVPTTARLVEPVCPMLRNAVMMPHDRAEQPDERRHARRRGEERKPPLELVDFNDRRAHQRTIDGGQTLQSRTTGGRLWIAGGVAPLPRCRSCAVSSAYPD